MRSDRSVVDLVRAWETQYCARTARSQAADRAVAATVAQSQRRRFNSGLPHPVYVAGGQGARVRDVDGNDYTDLNAGWNAGMLGRGHPEIVAAITSAAEELAVPGGPMLPSLVRDEFARLLCERIPGAERLTFAPSGSEANGYAIRLARAHTGREKIIRTSGGYHGQYDYLIGGGTSRSGLPHFVGQAIIEVPFNDADAACRTIESNANEACAFIVEPMMTIPGAVHLVRAIARDSKRTRQPSAGSSASRASVKEVVKEVVKSWSRRLCATRSTRHHGSAACDATAAAI